MSIYSMIDGASRQVKNLRAMVGGTSRKVKEGYVMVNGASKRFYVAEQIIVPNPGGYPGWQKVGEETKITLNVGNTIFGTMQQTYDEAFGVKTRGICIGLDVANWNRLTVSYVLNPTFYPESIKISAGYGTGGATTEGFENATFWYSAWAGTTQARTDSVDLSGISGIMYFYFGYVSSWGDHGISMDTTISSMILS